MKYKILFLLCSLTVYTASAQTVCEKLAQEKSNYYGFKPTSLTTKQQEAKSKQLDKFWDLAKTDPEAALPCLKDLIAKENNDPYFCFDASTLILTLDKKEAYLDAVLQGVNKADLTELQLEPYLNVCFFLGNRGKDVVTATEKLISTPNAQVFLTQHVINLNASDASIFLYNTMDTKVAESSLVNVITNGNATGRHNAAVLLNIISTDKGDSLLNKLMEDNKLADSTKKIILKDRETFTSLPVEQYAGKEEQEVRKQRKESIKGLSDEGLGRYFKQTAILMSIRSRKNKSGVK